MSDTYWNNVVLAMPMYGANGSTSFNDLKGHALTKTGEVHISTTQSKFGGSSAQFDGYWDFITTPAHTDFNFGSLDFTIECWICLSALTGATGWNGIIGQRNGSNTSFSLCTRPNNAGVLIELVSTGGTAVDAMLDYTFSTGQWYHIAASKQGSTVFIAVNGVGVSVTNAAFSNIYTSSTNVIIGRLDSTWDGGFFNGYIDDIRVTKGVARYTENFTPPTISYFTVTAEGVFDEPIEALTGTATVTAIGPVENHVNGQPWQQQFRFNDTAAGSLTWDPGGTIPYARTGLASAVTKDRVYLLTGEGSSGLYSSDIYTAAINPDGSLGTWSTTTALPLAEFGRTSVFATKGHLYALAHRSAAGPEVDVYVAPINSDGTLGTWIADTSLPSALAFTAVAVTLNRVYLLGGRDWSDSITTQVLTAPINSDGTLGTWAVDAAHPLPEARSAASVLVTEDSIYVIGGESPSGIKGTSYKASFGPDGLIGDWTDSTSLPVGKSAAGIVVKGNQVFIIGGYTPTGVSRTVYKATIGTDGELGSWISDNDIPGYVYGGAVFVTSSTIHLAGGVNSSFSKLNSTYVAPFTGGLNDYTDKIVEEQSDSIDGIFNEPLEELTGLAVQPYNVGLFIDYTDTYSGIIFGTLYTDGVMNGYLDEVVAGATSLYGYSVANGLYTEIKDSVSGVTKEIRTADGVFNEKPDTLSSLGFYGELLVNGRFNESAQTITGLATTCLVANGLFTPPKDTWDAQGQTWRLLRANGIFTPPKDTLTAQGQTWLVRRANGFFADPTDQVNGGTRPVATAQGIFAEVVESISGQALAAIYGYGRVNDKCDYITAHTTGTIFADGRFSEPIEVFSGGSYYAFGQPVLVFSRDTITI